MYILIKKSLCPSLKSDIREMIDKHIVKTWKFIEEDNRTRLIHTGDSQYEDVVLRFINTSRENIQYIKIEPFSKIGSKDKELAETHFGVVLGRFAELLNCHFQTIGSYETFL